MKSAEKETPIEIENRSSLIFALSDAATLEHMVMCGYLFAITILPIFWTFKLWNQPIRFYFWFIPLVLSSVRRISQRRFRE